MLNGTGTKLIETLIFKSSACASFASRSRRSAFERVEKWKAGILWLFFRLSVISCYQLPSNTTHSAAMAFFLMQSTILGQVLTSSVRSHEPHSLSILLSGGPAFVWAISIDLQNLAMHYLFVLFEKNRWLYCLRTIAKRTSRVWIRPWTMFTFIVLLARHQRTSRTTYTARPVVMTQVLYESFYWVTISCLFGLFHSAGPSVNKQIAR